jgi:hypothetical protein
VNRLHDMRDLEGRKMAMTQNKLKGCSQVNNTLFPNGKKQCTNAVIGANITGGLLSSFALGLVL